MPAVATLSQACVVGLKLDACRSTSSALAISIAVVGDGVCVCVCVVDGDGVLVSDDVGVADEDREYSCVPDGEPVADAVCVAVVDGDAVCDGLAVVVGVCVCVGSYDTENVL